MLSRVRIVECGVCRLWERKCRRVVCWCLVLCLVFRLIRFIS